MRDQYAGDISDLLKLALLRALVGENHTLGVGWYYNPEDDGRPDGRHREYRQERKWSVLDPFLWNALRELRERSVGALEGLPIWPNETQFHRIPVPLGRRRHAWALELQEALQRPTIVFLDPDNGVGTTRRHIQMQEIEMLKRPGRAIVLIKFPGREDYDRQLRRYHASLFDQVPCSSITTLRTTVRVKQPISRWFTIIDGDEVLVARAERFANSLNVIEHCKADIQHITRVDAAPDGVIEYSRSSSQPRPALGHSNAARECPECGRVFKGKGFDGIDAHWRARHEAIMPYAQAWPLVKAGIYLRSKSK